MKIVVIDGQGGGIGVGLISAMRDKGINAEIVAIGTNSIATANMIKAGAEAAATGENAVIVNARRAKIIAGPLGIVMADALLGEVTPAMAAAVGSSDAVRVLIPMNRCDTLVAGVGEKAMGELIEDGVKKILSCLSQKD